MSTLPYLPYIPLEVAENIIDYLGEDVWSLRSCALTCRGWNRHARYHLVASIRVQSREDLYSIHDYFASNPRMASFVRRLSMSPHVEYKKPRCLLEVLPVDLLKLLPNLRSYCIFGPEWYSFYPIAFHSTTFIRIKTYLHVEELHLQELRFRTGAELARVLIALPRLQRLEYGRVKVDIKTADTSRFRDKCNMLSEVTVCTCQAVASCTLTCPAQSHPWTDSDTDYIVPLIVQISFSTLRVLRCDLVSLTGMFLLNIILLVDCCRPLWHTDHVDLSELKHLHSLDITSDDTIEDSLDQIVPVIATVPSKKLRSLTISFSSTSNWPTSSDHVTHPLDASDEAMLALGTSVVVSIPSERHKTRAIWSKVVQAYLPRLHEAKLLQVQCSFGA